MVGPIAPHQLGKPKANVLLGSRRRKPRQIGEIIFQLEIFFDIHFDFLFVKKITN